MTNTPRQAPGPTPPKMDVEKEVVGLRGIAMNKGLSRTINDTKVAPLPKYKPGVGPLVNKLKMKALQPLANAQQGLRSITQAPQKLLSGKQPVTAQPFIGPKLDPNIPVSTPAPTKIPTPTAIPTPIPRLEQQLNQNNPYAYTKTNVKYGPPKQVPPDLRAAVLDAQKNTGVPAELLLALSNKETGMQNINQHEGGLGRGYFQFDLGQRPDITPEMAADPVWAANRAAQEIQQRMQQTNPFTNKTYTLWEAIAAHNVGPNGVYSNVISPYYKVPLKDVAKTYADDVFSYLADRDWLAQ